MGTRDSYNEIFLNTNRTNLTNILFCTRITRSLFAVGRSWVLNTNNPNRTNILLHTDRTELVRGGALMGGLEHEIRRRSTNSCMSLPMTSYILF